jgi:hypothetical protein
VEIFAESDRIIIAVLQGTAFFTSVLLIGFIIGHESVIRHILERERGYQKGKPAWQQPECYAVAKRKSRAFFPLYWYWGNVRSGVLFWLPAFALSADSSVPTAAVMAASLIIATNLVLYFTSKQPRWEAESESES